MATLVGLVSWRGKWNPNSARFDVQWAVLALATLFVSPYANFHDLSLLLVVGVLTTRARSARWDRAAVPIMLAWLPIVGYASILATQLSAPTWHVQLSVLFLAGSIALLGWVTTQSLAALPSAEVTSARQAGNPLERAAILATAR